MSESKKTSIFILLLNWNGYQDTLECLESLQKITSVCFQIVIIDNHSQDQSVAMFRQKAPHIPVLETTENLGFAGGNNHGIRWALEQGAEWIFLLNNDTIVDPDSLSAFLSASQAQPKAKILGAKIYQYHKPSVIDHLGGMWEFEKGDFMSLHQGHREDGISYEKMHPVDYVCGAAFFVHRSVFETIGFLEEKFFLLWEEADFCFRAKRAGFQIWTAPQAKVWHKVSSSFVGGKPHMHYFWWRGRLLWIHRNCSPEEKKRLYYKILLPELIKMGRHFLLRTLSSFFSSRSAEQALRLKAGWKGVLDYYQGRFGNCPQWITLKKSNLS